MCGGGNQSPHSVSGKARVNRGRNYGLRARTRAYSTAMPRQSPLAALLRRYGIADVQTFRPLDEGLLNRSFAVATGAGPLFLKQYLDQGPRQINAQHAATAALAASGLPVVPPL